MAKAVEVIEANKQLNKVPYNFWRLFHGSEIGEDMLQVHGDQVSFGEDFASLENAQLALKWFVDQLGGKVKWQK